MKCKLYKSGVSGLETVGWGSLLFNSDSVNSLTYDLQLNNNAFYTSANLIKTAIFNGKVYELTYTTDRNHSLNIRRIAGDEYSPYYPAIYNLGGFAHYDIYTWNNLLCIVYSVGGVVYFSYSEDGISWSVATQVVTGNLGTVSLASYGSTLSILYKSTFTNLNSIDVYGIGDFSASRIIATDVNGFTATSYKSKSQVIYHAVSDDYIYGVTFDDTTITGPTLLASETGIYPTISKFGSECYVAYLLSGNIRLQEFDGSTFISSVDLPFANRPQLYQNSGQLVVAMLNIAGEISYVKSKTPVVLSSFSDEREYETKSVSVIPSVTLLYPYGIDEYDFDVIGVFLRDETFYRFARSGREPMIASTPKSISVDLWKFFTDAETIALVDESYPQFLKTRIVSRVDEV